MTVPSREAVCAVLESVLGKHSREEATDYHVEQIPLIDKRRNRALNNTVYLTNTRPDKRCYDTLKKRLASFKESTAFYLTHYGSSRVFILAACGFAYFRRGEEVGCPCCLRKVTCIQIAKLLDSMVWDPTDLHSSECSLFKQTKSSCSLCPADGFSRSQWTFHLWHAHLLPNLSSTRDQLETANEAEPNVKSMTLVEPKTIVSKEPSLEISDKLISPSMLVRPATVVSMEPTLSLSSKVIVVVSYHPTREAISIASVDEIDSAEVIRQMTAAQVMDLVSTMIPCGQGMAHLAAQESTSSPIENNITALMDRSEYDVLRANVRVMRKILGLVHSEREASAGRSE